MESHFFGHLLTHFRTHGVSAYYSRPVLSDYPLCEIDHKETQIFSDVEIIDFYVTLFFDHPSHQKISDYSKKIEQLLEEKPHIFDTQPFIAIIRVTHKKQVPHDKGKLRQYVFECRARIRHHSIKTNTVQKQEISYG